jgi:hypothetical protein
VGGKKWSTRYKVTTTQGATDVISLDYTGHGARRWWTTPAGTFDAFRVEGNGWARRGGRREFRYWAAPDKVHRFVVNEQRWWDQRSNAPIRNQRTELISFSEARAPA